MSKDVQLAIVNNLPAILAALGVIVGLIIGARNKLEHIQKVANSGLERAQAAEAKTKEMFDARIKEMEASIAGMLSKALTDTAIAEALEKAKPSAVEVTNSPEQAIPVKPTIPLEGAKETK